MTAILKSDPLSGTINALRLIFRQKYNALKKYHARRKRYRITHAELSRLSDRGLGDLGIPRCSIKRLALEAIYDR